MVLLGSKAYIYIFYQGNYGQIWFGRHCMVMGSRGDIIRTNKGKVWLELEYNDLCMVCVNEMSDESA